MLIHKSRMTDRKYKLLTRMNIKVQHLISDIEGVGGRNPVRGIAGRINNVSELPLLHSTLGYSP